MKTIPEPQCRTFVIYIEHILQKSKRCRIPGVKGQDFDGCIGIISEKLRWNRAEYAPLDRQQRLMSGCFFYFICERRRKNENQYEGWFNSGSDI